MMHTVQKKNTLPSRNTSFNKTAHPRIHRLRGWLSCWEIYPLLLLAAFLRFYQLNTTEFDADQAAIFRMAHDAVIHGHLVATSNIASVGNFNPPGIVYFLMFPAFFSADPVWGAVWTAALAVVSVALTYFFTRRYYGRVAGIVATLLYATAALPVFYSRFMWNQNLLLPFIPLYLFVLFRGAVERRSGWLPFAIFLLGLLFQLHGSALLLAVPLVVVIAVAPKTVRWRDIVIGLVSLLVIYSSYILWEISTKFNDIVILFNATKRHSVFDFQPFVVYQFFLSPYNELITGTHSLLEPFIGTFNAIRMLTTLLLIISAVVAFMLVMRSPVARPVQSEPRTWRSTRVLWRQLRAWWKDLSASPSRCGLLILLVWQVAPLLYLLHRSITLYAHYLIILMPGPFILIGIFTSGTLIWFQHRHRWWWVCRVAFYGTLISIAVAQIIGSMGSVLDLAGGHFVDTELSGPYYNDLASMQNALSETDRFAQQHHMQRIYIDADNGTLGGFSYLSSQMHTSTTIFDDNCLVLPAPTAGPSLLLVGPYNDFTNSLVAHFAQAHLVASLARLGGRPFRLYAVTSSDTASVPQTTLSSDLQLLGSQPFRFGNTASFVTRWRLLRSMASADDTFYSYKMLGVRNANIVHYPGQKPAPNPQTTAQGIARSATQNSTQNTLQHAASPSQSATQILAPKTQPHPRIPSMQCTFTSLHAGDQLFVSFLPPDHAQANLNLNVQFTRFSRDDIMLNVSDSLSLTFETYKSQQNPWETLKTSDGVQDISIPTS